MTATVLTRSPGIQWMRCGTSPAPEPLPNETPSNSIDVTTRFRNRIRPGRLLAGLRDAWLIFGATIAIFVVVELAYRAQGALRRSIASRGSGQQPVHPYAGEEWWARWDEVRPTKNAMRYDAYRGWWPTARSHADLVVDSLGRRVTPQPASRGEPTMRVFTFGGSTMWGYTARDSFTIPALLARELRARDLENVEVVNLSQTSFNATQGAITLLLELRRGERPDAVVFLDGLNDVSVAYQSGTAGPILNEPLAAQGWRAGRRGFWGKIVGLSDHSLLVTRLARFAGRAPAGEPVRPDPEKVCGGVADYYRNITDAVERLGSEMQFETLFFWQPALATTKKPLTPFERSIWSWGPGYDEMIRACGTVTQARMADREGKTYFTLANIFDQDTSSIFLDTYGHVTEQGNAIIAARIADHLAPRLRARATATLAPLAGARSIAAPAGNGG